MRGIDESDPQNPGWESDDASQYRRPRHPVEIRRRGRWKTILFRVWPFVLVGATLALVMGGGIYAYRLAATSVFFQVGSLEAIEVGEAEHAAADVVRQHFRSDIGRSILSIPLQERRRSLEEIPWVEAATVQRVFPDRLRVHLRERTPVAFVRKASSLWLVDRYGVILPMPEEATYSFPVLNGLSEAMPMPERRTRLELYLEFMADLDKDGKNHSAQVSELDLDDAENLRAIVAHEDGAAYLHFGRGRYQEKFEAYLEHRSLWERSGESVRSVDLRYRGQIVLNPDSGVGKSYR